MSEEPINAPSVVHDLNQVTVYDRISDPVMAIKTLGTAIFKSGLFGCDRQEQGEVLAMECLAQRKSPLELQRTYHFINGQLAIKADALLAKFILAGGSVNWELRTDERVEATFTRGQMSAKIVADMKEYVSNGTTLGAGGKTKDNWKRWPRRMLTARAISEGVRLIAPDCCFGTYVSEELEGSTDRSKTIKDLVPAHLTDKAVSIFVKLGELREGQTLDDLSVAMNNEITSKPDTFLKILNHE